jgi:predicted RNA binding protein YcfA (HicA-like mRNA interferase family)
MPRLKVLSGDDVVSIFLGFRFTRVSQKGSHVKLKRLTTSGETQTLVVPLHRELDRGTLRAIFNQACRYIPADQLGKHFFIE